MEIGIMKSKENVIHISLIMLALPISVWISKHPPNMTYENINRTSNMTLT